MKYLAASLTLAIYI